MTENSLVVLTQCVLSLAIFASLCLATPRHSHRLTFVQHPHRWRIPLRAVATALLVSALYIAVSTQGWGLGIVDLFGALTLAAFIVIAAATYRPQWLSALGLVGFLAGIFGMAVFLAG